MKIVRFYIGTDREETSSTHFPRDEAEALLTKAFGGFTRIRGHGAWQGGNDGFRGTTIIYECWSVRGYKKQIARIQRELEQIYRMKCVPALIIDAEDTTDV